MRPSPLRIVVASVLAVVAATLFALREFWSPDLVFIALLAVFLVLGQGWEFTRRFAPFAVLLVTYDAFRGIADYLNGHVHYTLMIDVDRWIGGGMVPSVRLQRWIHTAHVQWFDYVFYLLYIVHFLVPFVLAVLIWKLAPREYWPYVGAIVALSYAAFLTYVAFPAAPPWMASQAHLVGHLDRINVAVMHHWGGHKLPSLYEHLDPNRVAAVPSLHAAYPVLELLFVRRCFGRRAAALFAVYPLALMFGVVYFGEHYVFDVVLGTLYAIAAYAVVTTLVDRRRARHAATASDPDRDVSGSSRAMARMGPAR